MQELATKNNDTARWLPQTADATESLTVHLLTQENEAEVLAFLSERPANTFGMIGFIRSNGLASPHNRGKFYACRDKQGQLQGVALIGHATLFEARSEAAIQIFARLAQDCSNIHLLLGEQEDVQTFWGYYSEAGQELRLYCRELMYEQGWPVEVREPVPALRLATLDDLDLIVPIHALTVIEESGEDPLETNPEEFRRRCARRIEKGKTWVWIENARLIFKAEVVTDAPELVYLEGVWVDPQERGKGFGKRCLSQLALDFLQRARVVCLLVNEKNREAHGFYKKVGYRLVGYYDTIFLKKEKH